MDDVTHTYIIVYAHTRGVRRHRLRLSALPTSTTLGLATAPRSGVEGPWCHLRLAALRPRPDDKNNKFFSKRKKNHLHVSQKGSCHGMHITLIYATIFVVQDTI